jgi:hypothetical protein
VSDVKKAAESAPSRVIDLDGARAARTESQPVTLKFGGKDFDLPGELPFLFAEYSRQERIDEALAALLGEDQSKQFFALNPSIEDLTSFTEAIVEVYGLSEGKSEGSQNS